MHLIFCPTSLPKTMILVKSAINSPSISTSATISCNSCADGFCPSILITFPSSFVVIVPSSESATNTSKAALNSEQTSNRNCEEFNLFRQTTELSVRVRFWLADEMYSNQVCLYEHYYKLFTMVCSLKSIYRFVDK